MHSPLTFNIHHLAGSCFPQHLGTGEQLRRFPGKATYHVTSRKWFTPAIRPRFRW